MIGTILRSIGVGLALALIGEGLHASEQEQPKDYVVSTLTSYHFDRKKDYNEQNFGLGLERRYSDDWALSIGHFENSFGRPTTYLFGAHTPWRFGDWRMGYVFGGVTGYDYSTDCESLPDGRFTCRRRTRIVPWLTGVATRDWGRFGVNVVFAPTALAFQIKWRID